MKDAEGTLHRREPKMLPWPGKQQKKGEGETISSSNSLATKRRYRDKEGDRLTSDGVPDEE